MSNSMLNIDYFSNFISNEKANVYFDELRQLEYQQAEVIVHGRKYTPPRKIAAFSDGNISYAFSGTSIVGKVWSPLLLELKKSVESYTAKSYNFALLNYYTDGKSKIGHHFDAESSLDSSTPIATLSFGATRAMTFTLKNKPTETVQLEHGSMLLMKTPQRYAHGIPPDNKVKELRISVTFRKMKTSKKRLVDDVWVDDVPVPKNSFSLGNDLYAVVSSFKGNTNIHLHKYVCKDENSLPSKEGVSFSPKLWHSVHTDIINFVSINDKNSIKVIGQSVFLSRFIKEDCEGVCIQKIYKRKDETFNFATNHIVLTDLQVEKVSSVSENIEHFVKQNLLKESLHFHVKSEIHKQKNSTFMYDNYCDPDNLAPIYELELSLAKILKKHFCIIITQLINCSACKENILSHVDHECLSLTPGEQFSLFNTEALYRMNLQNIAKEFIDENVMMRNFVIHIDMLFYRLNVNELYKLIEEIIFNDCHNFLS